MLGYKNHYIGSLNYHYEKNSQLFISFLRLSDGHIGLQI